MTKGEAASVMFHAAGPMLGFLGFIAAVLLGLALVGLAGRW